MFRPFQERKECPDRYENASKQQKKRVDESTCKSIGDVFFNEIDEEKFACLYSDVKSRPNIPVRILVTAMLLIRLFGITPGFFLEMLQTGALSFQYALHTTALLVQPLSERTLERFVSRLRKYKKETGQDLLYEEFQRIAIKNGIKMKLLPDPEEDEYQQWKEEGKRIVLRMDSFMCALHGKHMNRLELVYTANMINLRYCVSRDGVDSIPEELRHYLNENDHNAVIYYRAAAAEKEEIQQSRLQRTFDEMLSVKKLMEDL